jgi:hypothetical protein
MDLFRKEQHSQMGPGGFHCPCCNDSRKNGKIVKLMNKKARKKLKDQLKKEIETL